MENFPPEVLLFIFGRIPASHRIVCSEVCSLWYKIMLLQKKSLNYCNEYREAYREGDIYNIVRNINEGVITDVFDLVYASGSVKLMELVLKKKLHFYQFAGNYKDVYLRCLNDENMPMYNTLKRFFAEYATTVYRVYGMYFWHQILSETSVIDSYFGIVCSIGNIFFIRDFIKSGARFFDIGLEEAAKSGHLEAVKLLVEHGAGGVENAMYEAEHNNHPKVVEYLKAVSAILELLREEKLRRTCNSKQMKKNRKILKEKSIFRVNNKSLPKHDRRKPIATRQRSSGR